MRYSGFFGVRSVGPVGDFLDVHNQKKHIWLNFAKFISLKSWLNNCSDRQLPHGSNPQEIEPLITPATSWWFQTHQKQHRKKL